MRKLLCLAATLLLLTSTSFAVISGIVSKDAVAVGGNLMIGKTGSILGDAACIGDKLTKELGLKKLPGAMMVNNMGWTMASFGIASFLSFLVLGLFVVAFFSDQVGRASYYMERLPSRSFLWGLLMIILVVPVILLLIISLIGIAFIPAYILLIAAAAIFGYTAISQLLGKKILKALRIRNKPMMIEVVIGFIFFELIALIPIVGCTIKMVAAAMGLGASFATRFGIKD